MRSIITAFDKLSEVRMHGERKYKMVVISDIAPIENLISVEIWCSPIEDRVGLQNDSLISHTTYWFDLVFEYTKDLNFIIRYRDSELYNFL